MDATAADIRPTGGGGPGGGDGSPDPTGLIDPKDPLAIARTFVAVRFTLGAWRTLLYWRGDWYRWQPRGWHPVDELTIRGIAYFWLETCRKPGRGEGTVKVCPNQRFINNVLDPLRNLVRLDDAFEGGWLPTDDPEQAAIIAEAPAPSEILPVPEGLLHMPEEVLLDPTPAFFATAACPVSFDEKAAKPARWLQFLDELWPDDKESKLTLQEVAGYFLAGESRLHKIVFMQGPRRSGKSTIAEILQLLVGPDHCCAPDLSSLGKGFGREPLIGKKLAVIPDARLGRQADPPQIVQALLSISGQDRQTIDRKHRPSWTGHIHARFLLISNELPALGDASGAFGSRLIMLQLTRSFLDQEDDKLMEKLLPELPGILLWALAGWQRLRKRGRFQQPKSGEDGLDALRRLSSDIQSFLEDRCDIDPEHMVGLDELVSAYNEYRKEQGLDDVTAPLFGKRLKAACPQVKVAQPRDGTGRTRFYRGIRLKPDTLI